MKNLYSYKNAIASGLKRYSKFLLLAISFFMLGSTAWAAAPSTMYLGHYAHDDNGFTENDLTYTQMNPLSDGKWYLELTLTKKNNEYFFGSSTTFNNLLNQSKLKLAADFSPACATSATQVEEWGGRGKLYVGHSDGYGECDITLIVTYINDNEYLIQIDSHCSKEPTAPEVTTGNYYLDNGKLVVTENVLNELYKDCSYNRYLTGMGVEIVTSGGDFVSEYPFEKDNNREWVDYRGKTFTINTGVTATENTCYRAYAYYDNGETIYKGTGAIVCVEPIDDPEELTFALATSNTSKYASSIKLTKEGDNVYSTSIKLASNTPTYFVVDSKDNIWARDNAKTIEAVGTAGTTYEESATMTKGQKSNGAKLNATSGKTIKVTFTKESDSAGSLTFTMDETAKTPVIRIGKQPVVNGYSVDMNFQLADWGCTPVSKIKIYYTTDGTEPTTSSAGWEYEINPTITSNVNFTRSKADLPLGEYKIKVSAMNEIGWSDLSDMASFIIECIDPEPAIPNISINNSAICAGSNATITVHNVADNVKYELYKVNGSTELVNIEFVKTPDTTEGTFSGIRTAGNYIVKASNNCEVETVSSQVTLTVIDAAEGVSIEPTSKTTNPWVPVEFRIINNNKIPYTLTYYDAGDNDVSENMVVVKNGDNYSLKIPRPEGWETGNASAGTTTYTVKVTQQSGDVTCESNSSLTITLNDTFDDCD